MKGPPYPDEEHAWVTLSGEFVCAMVAHGEPAFRLEDAQRQATTPQPAKQPKRGKR